MDNNIFNMKVEFVESNDIAQDISQIINQSKSIAYRSIDIILLQRNWLIGKRIHDEEIKETRKDNYGLEIIKNLSIKLTKEFGKGFDRVNLYYYLRFFNTYPEMFYAPSKQSFLSWTHYRFLLTVEDSAARNWYEKEAIKSSWSVRTLQRNISTQYYYRILASQVKEPVKEEMEQKSLEYQLDKLEHIKNPVILDFLGLSQNESLHESVLENAIISNLQKILLELGKGYAFVGRQYHISTDENDYYVDLVFYNYLLKCFVLIDLKVGKITHQDIGQMDMYVRMFDELIKGETDNPTLGIVLCSETSKDIARYSILKGNEQLFASVYKLYLPSEDDLRAEIEHQKELFYLKQEDNGDE